MALLLPPSSNSENSNIVSMYKSLVSISSAFSSLSKWKSDLVKFLSAAVVPNNFCKALKVVVFPLLLLPINVVNSLNSIVFSSLKDL